MLTGQDLDTIRAAIREEMKLIADEERHRLDELFAPTAEFKEKQLHSLGYALYLADLNATDSQLGRPEQEWEELTEGERITYLRYAKAAMHYLKEPCT